MVRIALFLALFLALSGCSGNWGWYVVDPRTTSGMNNLRFLISGLEYTVYLSAVAITISMTVGLLMALPARRPFPGCDGPAGSTWNWCALSRCWC
ncbi:MAG: hypothetical protein ACE368_14155 [Paracoccaceae bacterium]